jgi:hypothetical protein
MNIIINMMMVHTAMMNIMKNMKMSNMIMIMIMIMMTVDDKYDFEYYDAD